MSVCVRVSLITLGFRAESFNWAWSKSHLERSTSTSPRKLFLPKVSWCHTERMSVWVRRYSMRTRYCNDSEPGDLALRLSAARRSLTNRAWESVAVTRSALRRLTLRISLNDGLSVFFFTDVFLFPRLALSGNR